MRILDWISLAIAGALAVYLVIALLHADRTR